MELRLLYLSVIAFVILGQNTAGFANEIVDVITWCVACRLSGILWRSDGGMMILSLYNLITSTMEKSW